MYTDSRWTDSSSSHHHELIIADGSAPEILDLVQGALIPVVALGLNTDPLAAITTALAGENLETLHIVAHGSAGRFWVMAQSSHVSLQGPRQ